MQFNRKILFCLSISTLFLQLSFAQSLNQIGEWSDPIPFGIVPVAVANLPDGRLICWSSQFRDTFRDAADGSTFTEIFDPSIGLNGMALGETVTQTNHDMFCPGINNLPDGRILSAGGTTSQKTSIYDWRTNSWSAVNDMNIPRGYQGNVTLANGSVFTVGGSWGGGAYGNRDAEIWTENSGWSLLSGIKGSDFFTNNDLLKDSQGLYRVDNHAWLWVAPDASIFHAGPSEQMNWIDLQGNGSVSSAGLRANDTYSMKGTTVMFDIGKLLKVGGSESYSSLTPAKSNSFVIDINGGFGTIPSVTSTSNNLFFSRTMHNSTVLPDGSVLVTGGLDHAEVFTDNGARLTSELYNPETNLWSTVAGMATPRTYHSVAILMPNGKVFVGGGGLCTYFSDDCQNHFNAEIYSPPYLFNSDNSLAVRPTITAPEAVNYNSLVNVTGTAGIQEFSLIRLSSATHSTNNEQRRIPVDFTSVDSNYSLSIPNENLLPPGYYMLFALNANGVPSEAEIMKIGENVTSNILPDDLLVSLNFDENSGILVNDETINNNDFVIKERTDEGQPTVANDHTWGGNGVYEKGLELDGKYHSSNSILELPYNQNIAQIQNGITVMAWVYRDGSSVVPQTGKPANVAIFAHNYPAMFTGFHNSLLKWSFATSGGFTDCYGGYAPLNQWVHLAVTYDGQTARLYSNGIEICNSPLTGTMLLRNDSNVRSNFTISGFYEHRTNLPVVPYGNKSGITDELDGRIDDFKLFKRPLSANEIKQYYNVGLSTNTPGIANCNEGLIIPEYKINNGDWIQGNRISAPLGSRVYIRAKNYNDSYFITTPQYDGPTFNSINDSNRLTAEGAYQLDTFVQKFDYYRWGNPDRGNGLVDDSNVGQFVLTTVDGCPTVINFKIGAISDNNEPPNAVANASTFTGNSPLTVNFTGSNSTDDDGIDNYSWNFGDGSVSSLINPQHTFTTIGTYNVVLSVTDTDGSIDTDNLTIDVKSENS
ncbi:hypothetical protein A9200_15170, partial [Maribacter hydrothermalis]